MAPSSDSEKICQQANSPSPGCVKIMLRQLIEILYPKGIRLIIKLDRCNVKGVVEVSIERLVLAFAGSFVLTSLILSQLFSPYWLLFTAFVGANLLQSAFTGFCPLAKILKALGAKPGSGTFK